MGLIGVREVAPDHLLSTRRVLGLVGDSRRPPRLDDLGLEREPAERSGARVWLVSDGVDDALLLSKLGGEGLLLLDEQVLQF